MKPGAAGVRRRRQARPLVAAAALESLRAVRHLDVMFEAREVDAILRLAATSAPALSDCEVVASYLVIHGVLTSGQTPSLRITDSCAGRKPHAETPVRSFYPDGAWGWCFALRGPEWTERLPCRAGGEASHQGGVLPAGGLGTADPGGRWRPPGCTAGTEQAGELQRAQYALSATVARLEGQTNVHEVLSSVGAGAGSRVSQTPCTT